MKTWQNFLQKLKSQYLIIACFAFLKKNEKMIKFFVKIRNSILTACFGQKS